MNIRDILASAHLVNPIVKFVMLAMECTALHFTLVKAKVGCKGSCTAPMGIETKY